MHKFHLLPALIILGIFLCGHAMATQEQNIIVGDFNYPPYSYMDKRNQPTGIWVELVQKVIETTENHDFEIRLEPWKRALKMVEDGQAFAVFAPYYDPIGRAYLHYSTPTIAEQVELFCKEPLAKSDLWKERLKGKVISRNLGFITGADFFDNLLKDSVFKILDVKNVDDGLRAMRHNIADCYINDGINIRWNIKRLKFASGFQPSQYHVYVMEKERWAYMGFTRHTKRYPFRDSWLKKYNYQIERFRNNKTIQKLIDKYTK